eukprot:14554517-Alexandrium_andersonii.AAC.1
MCIRDSYRLACVRPDPAADPKCAPCHAPFAAPPLAVARACAQARVEGEEVRLQLQLGHLRQQMQHRSWAGRYVAS